MTLSETIFDFLAFVLRWLGVSVLFATVCALAFANRKRRLPAQPSPYATLDYRGGLKARRLRVVETLERAP